MTSIKALDKLNNFISREKHINSERNKTINECVNIIQQDLERLGQLEKENQMLKYKDALALTVECLGIRVKQLEKENQDLLMALENKNNEIKFLKELIATNPYKKAIEILNKKFKFKIKQQKYSNIWYLNYHILLDNEIINENEAIPLKEVIEDEEKD